MLRRVTDAAVFLGLLIPAVTLVGWQTGNHFLTSLAAAQVAMNPVTAVVFILISLSLLAHTRRASHPAVQKLGKAFTILATTVVVIKFLSFFKFDVQIDRLLFRQSLDADPTQPPNRMAPNTTVSFLFLGLSMFFAGEKNRIQILIFQAFALLTAYISFLVLVGYGYESKAFIQITYFLPMAFNSALTFFILSLGILCSRPDAGFTEALTSKNPGGVVARRLLPAVIGLPILLGWLRVIGEKRGFYDMEFGTAITIATMVTVSSAVIWWTAKSLNVIDGHLQMALVDIQRLNLTLSEQNLNLQTANGELEAFCSAASHDLRAPLTTIAGYTEILTATHAGSLNDEGKELLQRIIRSSKKMAKMIDGLLRLSRLARQELVSRTVNLSEICKKIMEDLKLENSARQVKFEIAENLVASGDANLLESLMTNLIRNAWKYTGRKSEAVVEFGVREIDGKQTFYVADNGAGFDMAQAGKLFGAFQRLHSAEEFEGTGIGLTTVKRIVQRHGGKIWAEAIPGQGATFYFTLS